MKIGDKVSFYIDLDKLNGTIENINENMADVLTYMGLIKNIPLDELNVT